jgi:hypothetical protein
MDTKDDGGPAFPGPTFSQGGHPTGHGMGMTLRDWFAGQALASGAFADSTKSFADDAEAAYKWADAMIAARGGRDE